MTQVFQELSELVSNNRKAVMATVIKQKGSLPRSVGTRCLVMEDGSLKGTIGGGKLEFEVVEQAKKVFLDGRSSWLKIDLTSNDVNSSEMICGGTAEVFIDPIFPENSNQFLVYRKLAASFEKGQKSTLYTLIREEEWQEKNKNCMLFTEDGEILGELESLPLKDFYSNSPETGELSTKFNPENLVFTQLITPPETVFIFGAGHVAKSIAPLAKMSNFNVIVIDERESLANFERFPDAVKIVNAPFSKSFEQLTLNRSSYIVILTKDHQSDRMVLGKSIPSDAAYVGMIGSHRKRKLIYDDLAKSGINNAQLEKIHSPIGLSIGSETPEEIAISIVAELIKERAARRIDEQEEETRKKPQLKTIQKGDPPPCLKKVVQCRGCNGWKPMLKAAREIPLWQKYPFGCSFTGLTVKYEVD